MKMRASTLPTLTAVWLIHAGLTGCAGSATASDPIESAEVALGGPIPDPLTVPAGHHRALALIGRGVQVYACRASPANGPFTWTLVAPQAQLVDRRGRTVGTHYAGPTWEALDGSKVSAKKLADVAVAGETIPWLLLQAATHQGNGRMSSITYIQRLKTEGGRAPEAGCSASQEGARAEVAYSALYVFYTRDS